VPQTLSCIFHLSIKESNHVKYIRLLRLWPKSSILCFWWKTNDTVNRPTP